MNPSRLVAAILTLGASVVFFLAFRSEQTCSNRILHAMLGPERYGAGRAWLATHLPLTTVWKGSLPSALWVFSATLLLGDWKARLLMGPVIRMAFVPVLLNGLWEFVQWSGFTDGRADPLDVLAGVFGWGAAEACRFQAAPNLEPIDRLQDWRLAVLAAACGLPGFADVL